MPRREDFPEFAYSDKNAAPRSFGTGRISLLQREILTQELADIGGGRRAAGNTLPELASLTVIPAVQGLAGQKTGYDTWFDALAAMEKQMDACDYEVAIIGAGAYGLPLAAHARDTGHVAIQMSGATQLLFGIKGRRWDTHPQISKLYNPAWVRPAPAEQPANKQAVEGGSYW